jgi:hypothetical protein
MYVYDLSPYQISHANFSGSLEITIKPKAKYKFFVAVILSFYIPED